MDRVITIPREEYRQLIIDSARLMFVRSYVEQEDYLDKKVLRRWFENWKDKATDYKDTLEEDDLK